MIFGGACRTLSTCPYADSSVCMCRSSFRVMDFANSPGCKGRARDTLVAPLRLARPARGYAEIGSKVKDEMEDDGKKGSPASE